MTAWGEGLKQLHLAGINSLITHLACFRLVRSLGLSAVAYVVQWSTSLDRGCTCRMDSVAAI